MKNEKFTWRQRLILFAIYFVWFGKLLPGCLILAIELVRPGISFYHRIPLQPWLEISLVVAAVAVWWTEKFGPRFLRYAVSKL